ncbi:MAG: N-acyl homoserine lactonase family protein [Chloroflexaceae bacterium]|nr:N-acyl homoserine lactonase family protein [Chloroflexaceae bacterium]
MTSIQKLYVLLCGYEIGPKTISTRNRGDRFIVALPISAYLLETRQGLVLVDTGVNSAIINAPGLCEQYYTGRGWNPPMVLPQHELLTQLEQIGVQPGDISQVVLTHMHMDHTGNLRYFRHARISVQRAEHAYAFSPNHSPAWFEVDYNFADMRWHLLDGDEALLPGLQAIATPGHTPGHQSLLVQLPQTGNVLLVGDAGDMAENFRDEVLPGETSDDTAALLSIQKLKALASANAASFFYCHDPEFIQQVKLAPEYYS